MRVCQGDLIRRVDYLQSVGVSEGYYDAESVEFPLVVVLTQDCDLTWDYDLRHRSGETQDKRLLSVLVAPAYNAELVFQGRHLEKMGIDGRRIEKTKTEGKHIITNQNPRYHYLAETEGADLSPAIVDFKHYFSVPVAYLEDRKARGLAAALSPLHRADISQRFAAFLARIALPA